MDTAAKTANQEFEEQLQKRSACLANGEPNDIFSKKVTLRHHDGSFFQFNYASVSIKEDVLVVMSEHNGAMGFYMEDVYSWQEEDMWAKESFLKIKKLVSEAKIPVRASSEDAGLDIFSNEEDCTLESGERKLFSTGWAMEIPPGYYGRIAPRSGLAVKHGIDVLAGVVDSSYRNEVKVALLNTGDKPVALKKGDRIAQLIIEKCHLWEPVEVTELSESDRNMGGFGSTGV